MCEDNVQIFIINVKKEEQMKLFCLRSKMASSLLSILLAPYHMPFCQRNPASNQVGLRSISLWLRTENTVDIMNRILSPMVLVPACLIRPRLSAIQGCSYFL